MIPIRQCVACRKALPRKDLLRVTLNEKRIVVFDPSQKVQGRSAYVCPETYCIGKAQKDDLLGRGLHCTVPLDLYTRLAKAATAEQSENPDALIGFAARSRKLIMGMTAVENAVKYNKVRLIILDGEASKTTRERAESISRIEDIPLLVKKGKALQQVVGKANCRCIGLTDRGFAKRMIALSDPINCSII